MHVQLGQIIDKKRQKDQKTQLPFLKRREQKQGVRNKNRVLRTPPALNTTRGLGKTPKAPLQPDPYPHPI